LRWVNLALMKTVPTDNELASMIGYVPTTEDIKKCCASLQYHTEGLEKHQAVFIRALALHIFNSKPQQQSELIKTLLDEMQAGSKIAEEVLVEIFYRAANNKESLRNLSEKMPKQVDWQEWNDDNIIQDDILHKINSLRRIIPGTGKLGGIPILSVLDERRQISGAAAMKTILKSTLPLMTKLRLLSAIGRAKIADERRAVISKRSAATINFYKLLAGLSDHDGFYQYYLPFIHIEDNEQSFEKIVTEMDNLFRKFDKSLHHEEDLNSMNAAM